MAVGKHGGGVDGQYDGFAMSGTDFDCGFDICRKMDEMARACMQPLTKYRLHRFFRCAVI